MSSVGSSVERRTYIVRMPLIEISKRTENAEEDKQLGSGSQIVCVRGNHDRFRGPTLEHLERLLVDPWVRLS